MISYCDALTLTARTKRPKINALIVQGLTQKRITPDRVLKGRHVGYYEDRVIKAVDILIDAHGTDCIRRLDRSYLHYVNCGDTYKPTLLWTDREGYTVGSWGDIVEADEIEYIKDMEPEALAFAHFFELNPVDVQGGAGCYYGQPLDLSAPGIPGYYYVFDHKTMVEAAKLEVELATDLSWIPERFRQYFDFDTYYRTEAHEHPEKYLSCDNQVRVAKYDGKAYYIFRKS